MLENGTVKSMRILTISDIHGEFNAFNLEKLPAVDVVLIASDLTHIGLRAPAHWQAKAEAELERGSRC
jgi:Icc-related predicted phosphoesterase